MKQATTPGRHEQLDRVIHSAFDSSKQLKNTLDLVALTESLFGTSDPSPLSTPEATPLPSPILRPMEVDNLDHPNHLQLETPIQASTSACPSYSNATERQKAKNKKQSHAHRHKSRLKAHEATYANLKVKPECTVKFVKSTTM